MRTLSRSIALLALTAVLAASPAVAETFTVELANGTSFTTRYRPQEASWDAGMILFLTEHGNWIALPRESIADVVSLTELRGFGKLIDATTIDLGFAANDAPLPDEEGAQTPLDVLQNLLEQRPVYDQQQGVRPREAGGGIPVDSGLLGGGNIIPFGGGGQ